MLSLWGPRLGALFFSLALAIPAAAQPSAHEVASRWAPIHRQDVDTTGAHALEGRSDYLTAIDFDGDWIASNNWENVASFPLRATVYYSVVESTSHWHILYAFFHPRDWTDRWFSPRFLDSEHENDLEAVLFSVRKDGSGGRLESAVTVFHSSFRFYLAEGVELDSAKSVAGTIRFETHQGVDRPVTAQEAKGHGLALWPDLDLHGEGGVIYRPGSAAEEPNDPDDLDVSYQLVDIFAPGGLWERRHEPALFHEGRFVSDNQGCGGALRSCETHKASAPWDLFDGSDPGAERGWIATDPARLLRSYLRRADISGDYVRNPYRDRQN